MKSFEHYKFKAQNLKIAAYTAMTPFLSIIFQLITGFQNDYRFDTIRALIALTVFLLGVIMLDKAINILEQCDARINNSN